MCQVLGVSRSGFYKWQKHVPSQREESTKALESMIKEIYKEHKGRFGCPKMLLELKERGIHAGKNRVAALMRANGLRAITHRKFRPSTTDSNHELPIAENLLNRDFTATGAAQACQDKPVIFRCIVIVVSNFFWSKLYHAKRQRGPVECRTSADSGLDIIGWLTMHYRNAPDNE